MQNGKQPDAAKQQLRRECLARRRQMSQSAAALASRQICRHLNRFLAEPSALQGSVLSYLAYGREVNLAELHREFWRRQLPLAAPRTIGLAAGVMQPRYLQEDTELEKSPLGVWEPPATAAICQPRDLAAVLLPGVAFDEQGGRLGHGAGYYDRFLALLPQRPLLIGVAYEWQVLAEVPQEPWDQRLDYLVTEDKIRNFTRG